VVDTAPLDKILVIIPTYNEAENIEPIIARLRRSVRRHTCSSPTTTRRTAPGISLTGWRGRRPRPRDAP